MTISTTSNTSVSQGNGSANTFNFGFIIPLVAELFVTYVDTNDVEWPLSSSQYSVSGLDNPSGGVVTYPLSGSPIPIGSSLIIQRIVAYQQLTSLVNQSGYYPNVVEQALDNLTMQTQQLAAASQLALTVGQSSTAANLSLPSSSTIRSNNLIGFDANGNVDLYPITSSVGAGDLINEGPFVAGVGFTPGVTTSLVLSRSYGSDANVTVHYDAAYQGVDQYSINGDTITFIAPIPVGVNKVYIVGGTTLSVGIPSALSQPNGSSLIGYNQGSTGAITITQQAKNQQSVSIKDFGAIGNGVADDSTAFNAATTYCIAAGLNLFFPAGTYLLNSPNPLTGRCFLFGNGDATLIGNISYTDTSMPESAGSSTSLTQTAPFLQVNGLNFSTSSATLYGLTVTVQVSTIFLDTCIIEDCKFYGTNGLSLNNVISGNFSNNWFYNSINGTVAYGCENLSWALCRWRNQAALGYYAGSNGSARLGGESHKFTNCEWICCSTGVYLSQNNWSEFSECLFDYTGCPLYLNGCDYIKASNTYFGSEIPTWLTGVTGYIAPAATSTAVYGQSNVSGSTYVSGFSATNCEFTCYDTGTSTPLVYFEGSYGGVQGISRASFVQCKFLMETTHSMTKMLLIDKAQMVSLVDNEFSSYNLSSTLTKPYNVTNYLELQAIGTQTVNCTQSSVQVYPTLESLTTTAISAVPGGALTFADASGTVRLQLNATGGLVDFPGATVTNSATAGTNGALPAQVDGYWEVQINGGTVKIPYYNV